MNDKKQIFGWAMYDWANSAYITTTAVAILPIFFLKVVVPPAGVLIGRHYYAAESLWGFANSAATLVIFLLAPILGAISDFSASKKRFLMAFCYGGSLFAALLFFCNSGDVWMTLVFYFLSQVGFVGANVFYDAFLPQIASEDKLDWVSGKGYAFGYLGGGLHFAGSLALISLHAKIGISQTLASQIAMLTAALWWAGFSLFTVVLLKESSAVKTRPPDLESKLSYLKIGIQRTWQTICKLKNFKHLVLFLFAYMIYNDGLQTVIKMATIYGGAELGLSTTVLMVTLLIIQFVAFGGAFFFGWLGEKISAKSALMISLVVWCGVLVYAYYLQNAAGFMVLGVIVGVVMGGTASLSRSLYGAIIPVEAAGEFYGFYSVFSKFSGIFGMFMFGVVRQMTGSSRPAILALLAFFIIGFILLALVDVKKLMDEPFTVGN
ncbi:MAG: MFS transporter [Gemmatimonadetes bacterium]|nr:MAG: MFS transporter [Gemmatimonadota bacterium]